MNKFLGVLLGAVLIGGLGWYFMPSLGVAGLLFTQVPIVHHIMDEMGIDGRIQEACKYFFWILLAVASPYCLLRKRNGFRRFAVAAFAAVGLAYLAWYANDRWFAGMKSVDIMDPAIQAQAFDPYTGAANLRVTDGADGQIRVYWKNVIADPRSGLPTHPLTGEELQSIVQRTLDAEKQHEDQQRQQQATQAQLDQQAQTINSLQGQDQTLREKDQVNQATIRQQEQQVNDLQAQVNGSQRATDAERVLESRALTTLPRPSPFRRVDEAPVDVTATQAVAPEPARVPEIVPEDSFARVFSGNLRQGRWLRVRLNSDHTYFWSNGPFEFGVPPSFPKPSFGGHMRVSAPAGSYAMIRPLSPSATLVWYRNSN